MTLGMAILALLALAAPAGAVGERAGGTLIDASGRTIGSVQLEQLASGVTVTVSITARVPALTPGAHGIHFHTVGRCEGPDFMSAGGHYNPTGRQHGLANAQGAHAGDLPNFDVGAGTATQSGYHYRATTPAVTLSPGPATLFDADGTALVIHANADDHVTDPAGNSGGRIACAVLALTSPGLPNTGAGGLAPGGERLWLPAAALALLALAGLAATAARRRRAA